MSKIQFQYVLKLKIDSLVMLTYNVDTAYGLTSGTAGKVVSFAEKLIGRSSEGHC
jgi:hypothetical protein